MLNRYLLEMLSNMIFIVLKRGKSDREVWELLINIKI